jgi:hypothetical protein
MVPRDKTPASQGAETHQAAALKAEGEVGAREDEQYQTEGPREGTHHHTGDTYAEAHPRAPRELIHERELLTSANHAELVQAHERVEEAAVRRGDTHADAWV